MEITKQSISSKFDNEQSIVSTYINDLRSLPQLKHEELIKLFQDIELGGIQAKTARERIIKCNLRLVISIAKKYKNNNISLEDLIQEGNIGLMRGIEHFQWKKGYRFSTYATWWIRQAIGQHIMNHRRTIRLPAHAANAQRKIAKTIKIYRTRYGRDPSLDEIIKETGISRAVATATVQSMMSMISTSNQAFQDDNGEKLIWQSSLIDSSNDPYTDATNDEIINLIHQVMTTLSSKEQLIVRLRFGLTDDINRNDYLITNDEERAIASRIEQECI